VATLADDRGRAVRRGRRPLKIPAYKCERKRYKRLLREAFVRAGLDDPPAGGIVFGDDIAAVMDLRAACRLQDLDQFVSDFRAAIRRAAAGG